MKLLKSFLISVLLVISIFSSAEYVSAYNREKWKMPSKSTSYKWGTNLNGHNPNPKYAKDAWTYSTRAWNTASGLSFVYSMNSQNVFDVVHESSTTLYGRITVSWNRGTKNVTKLNGVINTNAKNITDTNVAHSTAVHEWGHAFGLAHNNGHSIMNTSRDRKTLFYPTTDDKNGIKAIYD